MALCENSQSLELLRGHGKIDFLKLVFWTTYAQSVVALGDKAENIGATWNTGRK
jgi:hypothetical protein